MGAADRSPALASSCEANSGSSDRATVTWGRTPFAFSPTHGMPRTRLRPPRIEPRDECGPACSRVRRFERSNPRHAPQRPPRKGTGYSTGGKSTQEGGEAVVTPGRPWAGKPDSAQPHDAGRSEPSLAAPQPPTEHSVALPWTRAAMAEAPPNPCTIELRPRGFRAACRGHLILAKTPPFCCAMSLMNETSEPSNPSV